MAQITLSINIPSGSGITVSKVEETSNTLLSDGATLLATDVLKVSYNKTNYTVSVTGAVYEASSDEYMVDDDVTAVTVTATAKTSPKPVADNTKLDLTKPEYMNYVRQINNME